MPRSCQIKTAKRRAADVPEPYGPLCATALTRWLHVKGGAGKQGAYWLVLASVARHFTLIAMHGLFVERYWSLLAYCSLGLQHRQTSLEPGGLIRESYLPTTEVS